MEFHCAFMNLLPETMMGYGNNLAMSFDTPSEMRHQVHGKEKTIVY